MLFPLGIQREIGNVKTPRELEISHLCQEKKVQIEDLMFLRVFCVAIPIGLLHLSFLRIMEKGKFNLFTICRRNNSDVNQRYNLGTKLNGIFHVVSVLLKAHLQKLSRLLF